MNQNIVAIDGPAGSGKSTVAKEIAEKIGFHYLDTGSYYRAFTLYFHRIFKKENKNLKFSEWILSQDLKKNFSGILIQTEFLAGGMNKTILNSEDVSDEIRLPEVTEEIKYLAPIREVRDFVNQSLHELSKKYKLIMDGRDIGTEVFPDAKYIHLVRDYRDNIQSIKKTNPIKNISVLVPALLEFSEREIERELNIVPILLYKFFFS